MRKREIDILRGMMIICVVIGHCSFARNLPIDVFWFHMPIFFMISGYLTKTPIQSPIINKEYLIKKTLRYVLPYFSYSIVLYCIFHPEGIVKNIVRTVYAGYNNITIYSYPFWFINALFVSSITFSFMLWQYGRYKKTNLVLALSMLFIFIVIHIDCIYPLPFPLPWGIDEMLGALVFMYLGYIYKGREHIKSCYLLSIIAVVFSIYSFVCDYDYTLNMENMEYNNLVLDLVVPCSFAMLFYGLSLVVRRIAAINKFFEEMGKASMTIFFTHATFFIFIGEEYPLTRISVALFLGYLIHRLLMLNTYLRLFFIGEYKRPIDR